MNRQVSAWVFTFNNYSPEDVAHIRTFAVTDRVEYLIIGHEVAPNTGTLHLQGFVQFKRSVRGSVVQRLIGQQTRIHVEPLGANSTPTLAADYCRKDGAFEEFGVLVERSPGKRNDWIAYSEWFVGLGRVPTKREIILHNPGLYARNSKRVLEIAEAYLPAPSLTGGEVPHPGWQRRLADMVDGESHPPREIQFVVDEVGNSGKSWFTRWAVTNHSDKVQVLKIGKRDDLAYAVDATKSVFLFDVPRTQMQFLQYAVLEMMKDQLIFSPKYESGMKVLTTVPLVVVFCNEDPDMTQMTADRYKITRIRQI